MSLASLKADSKVEFHAVEGFLDLLHGDPIRFATRIVHDIDTALGFVARSKRFADTPPPGNPDGIDDLADAYRDSKTKAEDLKAQLDLIAEDGLPDAIAGKAGTSVIEVLHSFDLVLLSDIEGFRLAQSALRNYAVHLRSAVYQHSIGANDIRSGRSLIQSIHYDLTKLANPVDAADELARVLQQLRAGLRLIIDGMAQCHSAYSQSWDDGLELRRRTSDSQGYARLANVAVPEGMSRLDVLAIRTSSPDDNPDFSILSSTEWANYEKRWDSMSTEERDRVLKALREAEDAESRAIILSAVASGAPISAVEKLAEELKGMTAAQRHEIANLSLLGVATAGGADFDQFNNKTCGSTSLLALAAQSDPFLAYWLATGKFLDGHVPAYLAGLDLDGTSAMSAEDRIAFAEQAVQDRANDNPLFGPDWPRVAGTAPGGAARDAGLTGTDYYLDWTTLLFQGEDRQTALTAAAIAANSGTPVPLLVGPDDDTFPQHYVLIVGYHDGEYQIYEPSSGQVHDVPEDVMINGSDSAVSGFGNWNQIYGVVLPED